MAVLAEHEHRFVEEQEPNGRLILGPCLVCDLSAMDAMDAVRQERDDVVVAAREYFQQSLPYSGDADADLAQENLRRFI